MTNYEELQKLAKLKEQWILSNEEFEIEKKKILKEENNWFKNNYALLYSYKTIVILSLIFWSIAWLYITYSNYKTLKRTDYWEKTWWIYTILILLSINIFFIIDDLPIFISIVNFILYWLINIWIFTYLNKDNIKEYEHNEYKGFIIAVLWILLYTIVYFILFTILWILLSLIYPNLNIF
jgi:hypothetical protein